MRTRNQTILPLVRHLFLIALLALIAQPSQSEERKEPNSITAPLTLRFGGPDSVQEQLENDFRPRDSLTGKNFLQRYDDWKTRLRDDHGLSFTLDYTAGILSPSNSISGENVFSGGAVRFYGSWDLVGRDTGNVGSFVWKIENRHRYSEFPVSSAASDIGLVGASLGPLSDAGTRLTNFYWKQNLMQGRMEIVAGMLDVTDWVDLYALASPWTGFFNFAFATGAASMALPDDAALGVYVNSMLNDNLFLIVGFADANADSTDPLNGFDTFGDGEYFKSVELGWTSSQDRFYLDNTHLTLWHVDQRVAAGVPGGWGANFSYSKSIGDKWLPFARAGYTDDGGSFLQKTISAGFGYQLQDDVSLLGLGVNWGQPNEQTFGPGLEDQYIIELFTRFQVTENLQVTPDIQYIINPAVNPDADHSLILGLRARVVF